MRIVQVSAHYPPNFISGGTLVPQRIARYLAASGHESYVYAGHLDESRAPLTTWDEADDHGVHVTWLSTTPWTAWTDAKNFDNPGATEAFETWLSTVKPDIVHVHSLQTLGVGLIEAARRAGAKVVLTMHDFWWFCSRQFLVDSNMRPCSLVVDCGACDCNTHPALGGRSQRLREALRSVDLVLAPSESAAKVFAANGVEPQRLRVNENGLPDTQLERLGDSPSPRTGAGPLRFMYAGGTQAMKGYDVLLAAARTLGDRSGLVLDAYGVADAPNAPRNVPQWFHARPAYRPQDLLGVLGEHDVLVLPSVMRESHSILTREALAAGLAVVCTDTLGPEEAITENVNGHIVPAGNPSALAEVLGRLADDPVTARTLTGVGPSSPIRSFSEQARELIDYYAEVVPRDGAAGGQTAGGQSPDAPDRSAVRRAQAQLLRKVLFIVGIDGAPLRYRVHLPAEALGLRGHLSIIRHYRDPQLLADIDQVDAVVVYRVPATVQVLELIKRVQARPEPIPVLFDVDDLIFDSTLRGQLDGLNGMSESEIDLWWHGVDRYRTTLEACDGFIGSTQALCDEATRLTGLPSYRFSNGVGMLLARASDRVLLSSHQHRGAHITIGYFSGTTTHDSDWAFVEPAVIAVMERHPEVRLRLGGYLRPSAAMSKYSDRIDRLDFTHWLKLPALLRETDICLAPLTGDSVFNESKSAIKWLEAALVERPMIASPTLPFREVIDDGVTGIIAETPEAWEDALESLISSTAMRARIGAMARRKALLELSPHIQGRVYEDLLINATLNLREHGRRTSSSWEPIVEDEPFSAADSVVDPYTEIVPGAFVSPPAAARTIRLARRAAAVAKSDGMGEVVRRIGGKLRSRIRL
ncbi:glycosyltransferase [Actinomyces sp.]|uniref:glycosyltransferase n=1 Tax=Actinomyces sp. TaxID=29317 RepID=UPI0026DC39B2|nr:glycosyltransferase [Actinomyces sp.]MDO4899381.1 glycosyltransferase [Actinomyces sp.]